MTGFNKIFLMGNLTRDPQLSYTPNQTAVVDFGLATNRRWTAQDGNQRQDTCFVDCRAFGRMAENINKYLNKGRAIFVEGRLTFESWTAQDGTKRSRHRVTVENFQFLPGTATADADQNSPSAVSSGPNSDRPVPQNEQSGPDSQARQQTEPDDIPF
jgi:single-strand DNA-binding protein